MLSRENADLDLIQGQISFYAVYGGHSIVITRQVIALNV